MHLSRMLELLQVVVPAIPDGELRMCAWVRNCGVPSCAGGWAAAHAPFVEEGLTLAFIGVRDIVPTYRASHAHAALCEFFQLEHEDEAHIFSGIHVDDLGELAQRIIDVIEVNTEGKVNYAKKR